MQKIPNALVGFLKKAMKATTILALIVILIISYFSSCGYSMQDVDDSFDRGYEKGYEEGRSAGYAEGSSASFDEGYDIGYADGYTDASPIAKNVDALNLSEYQRAFHVVSRFAKASDLSVKDYCRYCVEQQYMLDGETQTDATNMASENSRIN